MPARHAILLLALLGCDDAGEASPEAEDTPEADVSPAVDAAPDARVVDGSTPAIDCRAPDAAPPVADAGPILPPCERACDRVVDCATDACEGFNWTNAARLAHDCHGVCGGDFAEQMLAFGSCEEVGQGLAVSLPDYPQACETNPCFSACERLGRCVVQECPAIAAPADQQIANDCVGRCNPGDVAWIESAESCGAIVGAIADADPSFARNCRGEEASCPPLEACEGYGEKATGCMLRHCEGNLDAHAEGLRQALTAYCHTDENCPDRLAIEALLEEEVGCDHPWLRELGPAPPFGEMCAGRVPPAAELHGACEAFMACPGSEGLRTVALCGVFLALRADTFEATACMLAAEGCAEVYPCLEGE